MRKMDTGAGVAHRITRHSGSGVGDISPGLVEAPSVDMSDFVEQSDFSLGTLGGCINRPKVLNPDFRFCCVH
jgi:hypothetical protein